MNIDYGILKDRAALLTVASAAFLDSLGVGFRTPHDPIDALELYMDRVIEAFKKLDAEWDRVVEKNIELEREHRRTREHPQYLG